MEHLKNIKEFMRIQIINTIDITFRTKKQITFLNETPILIEIMICTVQCWNRVSKIGVYTLENQDYSILKVIIIQLKYLLRIKGQVEHIILSCARLLNMMIYSVSSDQTLQKIISATKAFKVLSTHYQKQSRT